MFINIHTHNPEHTANVIEIVQHLFPSTMQPSVLHSVGVHPWDSEHLTPETCVKFLQNAVQNTKARFIGECGLDRAFALPIHVQMPVFEASIHFAQNNNYPLIIHCVRAYSDMLHLFKKHHITVPIIFHDFRGNSFQVQQLSAFHSFFSFGTSLFTSQKMQNVFREMPLSRIFLETDTANISIHAMYQQAAHIKNISIETLKKQLVANFESCISNKITRK